MKNQLMCVDIVMLKTNKTVPFYCVIQICLFLHSFCYFSHHSSCKKKESSDRPTLPSKERWRTTKQLFFSTLMTRNWEHWHHNSGRFMEMCLHMLSKNDLKLKIEVVTHLP